VNSRICLCRFVKTFNEPASFCQIGYNEGIHAPGRCSNRETCPFGNSTTEPYLCIHSVLIAHAQAANLYHTEYKSQGGKLGMTLSIGWSEPLTNSSKDANATERALLFDGGIYAHPIIYGDYPEEVKWRAGNLLPAFTANETDLLKNSVDFFGLNHYTSAYGSEPTTEEKPPGSGWSSDRYCNDTVTDINGKEIGPQADSSWLRSVPWAFTKILIWINQTYPGLDIYVCENGMDVKNESMKSISEALNDTDRIDFLRNYTDAMEVAIDEGVPVKGYFVWSILDNFEWADGYSKRFGIHYVDYKNGLQRYPKQSAYWYSKLIQQNSDQRDQGQIRRTAVEKKKIRKSEHQRSIEKS